MRLTVLAFAILIMVSGVVSQTKDSEKNEAAKRLYELFDEEWEWRLKENPTFASYLGDKRYNDRWTDLSFDAVERRNAFNIEILKRLKEIDRTALSPSDRLNYDLFEKNLAEAVERFQYREHYFPVNQLEGIQTADEIAQLLVFKSAKDYEDWIARLNALPVYVDQTIALMREGIRERRLLPRAVLERIPPQIDKQIVNDPEKSAFYGPFKEIDTSLGEAERETLRREAKSAIAERVVPAFEKFKKFFVGEYLPVSYDSAGIWQQPDGDRYYAFMAKSHTTTSLSPKEIHETGLAEVARIRAEMEKIKQQVGFKGTLREFFDHLRTDEKFFYKTPEELLNAYRAISKRIDPEVVKVFRTLPRMPYGVIPVPDKIAPDTTTAYYNAPAKDGSRPGLYYVNLYKPESRPKWEMMALSIHEAVPGHHLQIALAQELGEIPNFRKFGGYTAFVEGWALYSESLGDEMGLYSDRYDKFGQLTYEMWRAVRLVVDTGMHHFKWDRQRAIDFFRDNAPKTEQDIVNEIDRYISWPGQALAYKVGELKIKELRARSARELGDRFDVKEFHDVVLLSGSVPLDILERHVDEWIKQNRGSRR